MSLSDYLTLDRESPSGLRWKVDVLDGRGYKTKAQQGKVAGSLNGQGRWQVKLHGKHYIASRVIYEMLHGEIPNGMFVDHIDGKERNNAHDNLRLVTPQGNTQNMAMSIRNRSGVVGVRVRELRGYTYVTAILGKDTVRSFSTRYMGFDEAFRLACEARTAAVNNANANGDNYTGRHGKRKEEYEPV